MVAGDEGEAEVRIEVFREPGGHLLAYAIDAQGELAWVRFDEQEVPVEEMRGSPLFARLEQMAAVRSRGRLN